MMNLPPFGIGTLHFGSSLNKKICKEIIFKAVDLGVNFFDTSPLYGNALSEEILGGIFSEIRQPVFIATKVGLQQAQRKDGQFGVEIIKLTEQNLRKSVENSLKKLKKETIDLLTLHAFDPHTPISETLDALIQLHQEGKIRYLGCSNYNPEQLKCLLKEIKKKSCSFFLTAQCHYNMIERRAGVSFIPFCEKNGLQIIINRALARGALSGQYVASAIYPEQSRAAKSWRIRKWLTFERISLIETLSRLSKKKNLSLTEIALIWLKKNHPKSVPLLGVRNAEQLNQCLNIKSDLLDETFFTEIEAIISKASHVYCSPPRYFEK